MTKTYPDDLRYTKDHEWVRIEGDLATVGITQFAVEQLGDITMIDLPKEGEKFGQGEVLATVESVKTASDIYAPVGGVVVKVNDPLKDSPETLNEDCYDEGWIVQISMKSPQDIDKLLDAAAYAAAVAEQE
jgi:glycine cleavage system H protein